MWIIVATVLLLYLLGFLFVCLLKSEQLKKHHHNQSNQNEEEGTRLHCNPSSVPPSANSASSSHHNHPHYDNTAPRASNINERVLGENSRNKQYPFCSNSFHPPDYHHHQQREQEQQFSEEYLGRCTGSRANANNSLTTSSTPMGSARAVASSSNPTRSPLFAYREQQLRQIHHEITQMSLLLGAAAASAPSSGTSHGSDERLETGSCSGAPMPMCLSTRLVHVQPLRGREAHRPYSFIHQLIPSSFFPISSTSSPSSSSTSSGLRASGEFTNANGLMIPYPQYNPNLPGNYSPGSSESCHIIRERQRRLLNIRMELEDLSLQLSHSNDGGIASSSASLGTTSRNSPTEFANVSLDNSNNLERVAGRGASPKKNKKKKKKSEQDNDGLPGYDSLILSTEQSSRARCVLLAPVSSTSRAGAGSAEGSEEESPPPSYSEALHLYSFRSVEERSWKDQKKG